MCYWSITRLLSVQSICWCHSGAKYPQSEEGPSRPDWLGNYLASLGESLLLSEGAEQLVLYWAIEQYTFNCYINLSLEPQVIDWGNRNICPGSFLLYFWQTTNQPTTNQPTNYQGKNVSFQTKLNLNRTLTVSPCPSLHFKDYFSSSSFLIHIVDLKNRLLYFDEELFSCGRPGDWEQQYKYPSDSISLLVNISQQPIMPICPPSDDTRGQTSWWGSIWRTGRWILNQTDAVWGQPGSGASQTLSFYIHLSDDHGKKSSGKTVRILDCMRYGSSVSVSLSFVGYYYRLVRFFFPVN